VTSPDLLATYLLIMELCFDAMFIPTCATTILMWAISNVHADRIWPAGRRFPARALTLQSF